MLWWLSCLIGNSLKYVNLIDCAWQLNWVRCSTGRLLRDADAQPDLLGALIQATKDGDQSRFQALADLDKRVDQEPKEVFNEFESESESESEQEIEVLTLSTTW